MDGTKHPVVLRHGEDALRGGDAVSLDLLVKMLDVLLKLVGISAGLQTLIGPRKKTRKVKKNHRQ
ncbi:hypothetical protein PAECIP111890_00899 [Paenibacillus sp. JJ-223]|nr:hypothetical protein PAECIP111890_00899 [Paenibacillus sp. JJ-223]